MRPSRPTVPTVATSAVAALLATACAETPTVPEAGDVPVQPVGTLSSDDAVEAGAAVTDLGFDLHRSVAEPGGNTVTSPLSASLLLSMVAAGAGGDTAEEMVALLGLDQPRDRRPAALLGELAGDGNDVELTVANALWAAEGVPFEDDFVAYVGDAYGATLDEVDLAAAETADQIDGWVADRTEGLIDAIADDLGLPSDLAVLILVNAVHFQGTWTTTFGVRDTRDANFSLADGTVVEVPTMHLDDAEVEVAGADGFRLLRLPYGEDERFGMEVILPDPGIDLDTLLADLDAAAWREAVRALTSTDRLPVALPRFELEWEADLSGPLAELGMASAFDGGDFIPMSPADPELSTVVQKTSIRVDEEGAEAAAVTGGSMDVAATEPFVVDRPFAFTVSDGDTGTVLFLGSVHDPRG